MPMGGAIAPLPPPLATLLHRRESGGASPSRRRLWGPGGEAPSRWAIFRNFLEKLPFLMSLDHISHILEPFEKN